MNNIMMNPQWYDFQHSLARMLKMALAIISPDGKPAALFNSLPFFYELYRYPVLCKTYAEFFSAIPSFDESTDKIQVVEDPLSIPVAVIPLSSGFSLILSGGLNKDNPDSSGVFLERLQSFGIAQTKELAARIPMLNITDLKNRAASVKKVYGHLTQSLSGKAEPDGGTMLLSAIEEINKFLALLLWPGDFDLRCTLDLVCNLLIILTNAAGAWVFIRPSYTPTVTVCRGVKENFLRELESEWLLAVNRGWDPVSISERFSSVRKELTPELKVEAASFEGPGFHIYLGTVNPLNGFTRLALDSFTKQVVTIVELYSLYNVLQQQLGTLLATIRYGIIAINKEGRTLIINRAAKDILAAQGVYLAIGEPLEGQGLGGSIEKALHRTLSSGTSFLQQQSLLEDNALQLCWDVTPLMKNNVIYGAIIVFEDITENIKLQRQKDEWETLATAGELAAGLAHEIRNPLATAGAAIQLFDMVGEKTKQKELLNKISGELERMNSILTDFLNISKPKEKLALQEIDLVEAIEELGLLLKSEAHLNNVDLDINSDLPESFPLVKGDKNGLKQVFLNIAKNAIEATGAGGGGRLEISLQYKEGRVYTSFRDNGPGIPEETMQNIFQPFFTTKVAGTGLGLPISSALIKKMGGELLIESELKKGTTVHVVLPVENGYLD